MMRGALRAWRAAALLLGALLGSAAVQADVWGYVDERNIAHFASEQVDARYELFYREDARSREVAREGTPDIPRPIAVPTLPPRLLAFFEVSTNYKAVRHLLRNAARSTGIDYELLQALIATESGFDPQAVSPRGAVGLMQLMPATAQRYGVQADARVPLERKLADPGVNIRAGTRFLRDLIDQFPGRLDVALAAYNAGEGAVQRAGREIPPYTETQNYVRTVMQLYQMLKPPVLATAKAQPVAPVRPAMAVRGGAVGRGNMIAPLSPPLSPPPSPPAQVAEFRIERD